ncbi:sarcosine dehydrogenase, mitochondrial-like [Palaemon carinicauda]|uniref:sarcosine dehydrogenase, mitochondrial-like n=1 Tax=Palaemon carinicauda TaxID=392227 RepID=UPI0035B62B16
MNRPTLIFRKRRSHIQFGKVFRNLFMKANDVRYNGRPIHYPAYGKELKNLSSLAADKATLPSEADVVVIGGGSLGCNVLYYLTKLGINNVILLEAHQLTSGTTWHTAGLLFELRHSDVDTQLIRTTRDLLLGLEDETGINPGWIMNGGLMVAQCKNRLDEYKRLMSLGRTQGIETYILDPKETSEVHPLMNTSDIVGTLYSPRDGTMDPSGFCTALTRAARRAGAKVYENCPVTDICTAEKLLGGKRVTEVHTPLGVVRTNAVVNAAGSWGNHIAKMVGVELPLTIVEHSIIFTEKIPGIKNTPNVREPAASAVLKVHGDSLAVTGFEKSPVLVEKLATDSPFMLYDLKWDVFGEVFEKSVNRIPALESAGIKSTICGPESFTPDIKPILGEDPTVEGFFHFCGGNGTCMMLGGGLGQQMAKWVIHGRPEVDMFSYDIRRFHKPLNSNKHWVHAKSHECFMNRYSVKYKHNEPLAGRGQRLSPLHEVLEKQGCVFQESHGWEKPGWFNSHPSHVQPYDWYGAYDKQVNTDQRYCDALKHDHTFDLPMHHDVLRKECLSCRNKAAIFDLSHLAKFCLTGPDAQVAADWLFTADVSREPGTSVYTCLLNKMGGVEGLLNVSIFNGEEEVVFGQPFTSRSFYLTSDCQVEYHVLSHLLKEIRTHRWDVEIVNHTDNISVLSVQGPESRQILQRLSDATFNNASFPVSTQKVLSVCGETVLARRVTSTGEMGWELHMPNKSAQPIYEALMDVGKPFGLVNAGYRALESLSAEKGERNWHTDTRPDDTPLEAGLTSSCKLNTRMNFLGREALERQQSSVVHKKLMTFTLKDPSKPLWGNEGIWRDCSPVGFLRRADYAFSLGLAIGYGYVKLSTEEIEDPGLLKKGVWEIESMGELLDVTIHLNHPFDPEGLRVNGDLVLEDGLVCQ